MYSPLFSYNDNDDGSECVNLTTIVQKVEDAANDTNARAQMRAGFVLYLEHYTNDDNPYGIDADGDYWVNMDVALFVIDHVTTNFEIVAIKKQIINEHFGHNESTVVGRLLCRYIVTGVGCDGDDGQDKTNVKKSVDLATQIVTILNSITSLWI